MISMRWLIRLFWLFIAGMLIWQFYNYNSHLEHEEVEHPQQQGPTFFYPANPSTAAATNKSATAVDGPNVQQVRYWVEDNTPTSDNFVAHFILKNVGNAKATNVQIMIRPYRGIKTGDEDNGHGTPNKIVNDADALSQYGEWVSVPALGPGEESPSLSVTFFKKAGIPLGTNPNPDITFASETAGSQVAPTTAPASKHDN